MNKIAVILLGGIIIIWSALLFIGQYGFPSEIIRDDQNSEIEIMKSNNIAQWITSIGTLFIMIFTGFGLYFIYRTYEQAQEANEAAKASVRETIRIGEMQARAYVSVSKVILRSANGGFGVSCMLSNSGNTPARDIGLNGLLYIGTPPDDEIEAMYTFEYRFYGPCGADKDNEVAYVPKIAGHYLLGHKQAAVFQGNVIYTDILGEAYQTDFWFTLGPYDLDRVIEGEACEMILIGGDYDAFKSIQKDHYEDMRNADRMRMGKVIAYDRTST